jgi:lysophospholipase L1-like esterase
MMTKHGLAGCLATLLLCDAAWGQDAGVRLDDLRLDGMSITVKDRTLNIAPLAVQAKKCNVVLKTGEPGWRGPVYTPGTAWVYQAMTKGSLKVMLGGTVLKEGADYTIDYAWGTLGAPAGSAAAEKEVDLEYTFTSSRLDLVVKDKGGSLQLLEGKTDARTPRLPAIPDGAVPLFSVYLPHNTTTLTAANINIMDPAAPVCAPAFGVEFIKAKLDKLKVGKGPFKIVFIGDSITAQTDPEGGSFVVRFKNWLEQKFIGRKISYTLLEKEDTMEPVNPRKNEIAIVMAGIGGNNSSQGLARLDMHVLVHKPDLVFIMFGVNDENGKPGATEVSPDTYQANLAAMVKKVRAAGGEPVLMTTSWKNLGWSATSGTLNEYAQRARRVAQENKVCLIDHYQAWEDLPRQGYNYMIYLGSCINHPNELGHALFFQGLKAACESAVPGF